MTEHDTDVEEIARLLPAPDRSGLPHERHLHHKEQLMRRIDSDRPATGRPARPRPARRGPAFLRPALLVPAAALALGGILATGIALTGTETDSGPGTGGRATPAVRPAAALLDQISDAAGRGTELHVRADQFAYTRAKVRGADLTSGKAVVGPLEERETWISQQPGPLHKLGVARADGETLPLNAELGDTDGTPAGFNRPTYDWLASLPTDPDALLDHLYAELPKTKGEERDQAVFDWIGGTVGEVMPPRTAAALYRAAARIPGVTKAPGARDVTGRRGVGIAREDTTFGTRTEWVFDERDLTFLGDRSYLVRNTEYGTAGTLMSGTAVLDHALVDEAGEEPATARES
ncbi:CU044_5270 family protein [Streptomyces sp. KL116D]|uniref:CU044_5270 family protein n=1 Tax=Streptomyces sp. KL116D TaxID=3045152 RepID=UPI0035591AAF